MKIQGKFYFLIRKVKPLISITKKSTITKNQKLTLSFH